jgi:NAD(P)H dehydrogenase (quinone)
LRNSWYSENYLGNLAVELERGVITGCAGKGRISAAPRLDFAAAAAAVLTGSNRTDKIYELAGDQAFTMDDLAACVSQLGGRKVVYLDMPEADYAKLLEQVGLPAPFARILANASAGVARGNLYEGGRQLSTLIGRPTTPLKDTVASALAALH